MQQREAQAGGGSPDAPRRSDDVRARQVGAGGLVLVITSDAMLAARLAGALGLAGSELGVVTARSGIDGIRIATGRDPIGMLVIDHLLPGLTGLVVTRAIRGMHPDVQVVMLVEGDDDEVVEALGAGAEAVFGRRAAPSAFPRLVQRLQRGERVAEAILLERPGVAARMVEYVQAGAAGAASGAPNLRGLTARELAVVDGVAQGMSNRAIAERLGLSEQTVKNHMTAIMRKMQVQDRQGVLRLVTGEGWARVDDGAGPGSRVASAG